MDRMEELSARIDAFPEFSDERAAVASLLADAQPLAFDGEGRVILPEALCRHTGISELAAFVGLGPSFQIWEPQRFEAHREAMREAARRTNATLPSLGAARALPGAPK